MNPITILETEHRLALHTLTALEQYVDRLDGADPVDRADLGKFVTFFQEFVDKCHHAKEEGLLFSAMVAHGFSRTSGPIPFMLHEHQTGRRLVQVLALFAAQAAPWSAQDLRQLTGAAHTYVDLLRQHIQKENQSLFPAAQARLPEGALAALGERFEQYEQQETGAGEHERFHRLAEELIERYVPERLGPRHVCGHAV